MEALTNFWITVQTYLKHIEYKEHLEIVKFTSKFKQDNIQPARGDMQ